MSASARVSLARMFAGIGAFLPWMCLRVLAMVATVSFATVLLGLEAYGQMVTALAIGGFLSPLAGLGLHMRVMSGWRDATDRRQQWLASLAGEWLVASLLMAVLGAATAFAVFRTHAPHWLLGGVLGLEVFAASGVEWMSRIALMRGGTPAYARLLALFQIGRLVFLLPLGFFDATSLAAFAGIWSIATGVSLLGTAKAVGLPRPTPPNLTTLVAALRAGSPFMAGATAYRVQAEFNKPVVAGVGFALAGGLGLAQRVMDVASLPVLALQVGLFQRVFSGNAAYRIIALQALFAFGMASLIGVALAVSAPMLQEILGTEFAPALGVILQLAALPAVQVLRQTGTLLLVFRERARLLPAAELPACASAVWVTLWLVPSHGIGGAVWGLYVGEAVQIGLLGLFLWVSPRKASAGPP